MDLPDEVLLLEPRAMFDKALIGVAWQAGVPYAVYSREKAISALELPEQEALEHYDFNVSGSIGTGLPVFMSEEEDLNVEAMFKVMDLLRPGIDSSTHWDGCHEDARHWRCAAYRLLKERCDA